VTTRSGLGVGGVGFGELTELVQAEGVGQADGDVEEAGDPHRFGQLQVPATTASEYRLFVSAVRADDPWMTGLPEKFEHMLFDLFRSCALGGARSEGLEPSTF
jgi:hypothetical protein